MAATPIKIRSAPGIKRDGTRFEGDFYTDGQWCRWQRGLTRKIGGYQATATDLQELVYGLSSFSSNGQQYLHLGSESFLQQRIVNNSGVVTGAFDRTPASLVPNVANIWSMDVFYDTNFGNVLVAQAAANMDISNALVEAVNIWYGTVTGSGALADSGQDPVSGGVITVGNYLVSYGSDGFLQSSDENDITGVLETTNITQQKLVSAKRIRGNNVPAALLWSLDSLLQISFAAPTNPGDPLWNVSTLAEEISILSSRGPIEYDGIFYWPAVDRFMSYNGVVREVPNQMNVNFFFDNLNFEQRQKVFAFKVPRFGEIWWCFPTGANTECDHAVIFNVREGTWYDTEITQGRTDGIFAKVYNKPFMTGATQTSAGYDLWQHETGVNSVRLGVPEPIPSHFETHEFSVVAQDEKPENKSLAIEIVEPDFVQVGDLKLTIRGRANARSTVYNSAEKTITEVAATADQEVVRLKEDRRLMSFKFESNTLDGTYQMGEILGHITTAEGRITQGTP